MLTGLTEETMEREKKKCEKKFEQELLDLWKDAAEYRIKTYDEFVCKLERLNFRYLDEMEDFEDFPSGIVSNYDYDLLEKYKDDMSLQVYALYHLSTIYGIKSEVPLDTDELAIPFQVIFGKKHPLERDKQDN